MSTSKAEKNSTTEVQVGQCFQYFATADEVFGTDECEKLEKVEEWEDTSYWDTRNDDLKKESKGRASDWGEDGGNCVWGKSSRDDDDDDYDASNMWGQAKTKRSSASVSDSAAKRARSTTTAGSATTSQNSSAKPATGPESWPTTIEGWKEAQRRLFPGASPLPPDWIRMKSKSKNCDYFYNFKLGTSTFEEPTE
eukprot:TRINITY_DN59453_c0_g1_i1.p1 TRINITY_DN59453_c0_g1~~TRINITY_DN59453_c0_g1_i1.p1  ORF type:complete len:226 (-),score=48.08 TRINITY_DN59453_c0_g1_i1:52-636(-)